MFFQTQRIRAAMKLKPCVSSKTRTDGSEGTTLQCRVTAVQETFSGCQQDLEVITTPKTGQAGLLHRC